MMGQAETDQLLPDLSLVVFAVSYRMQQLEKEYETLKENDPAELQKAVSLTQVGSCRYHWHCWAGPTQTHSGHACSVFA